jgi:excisionase family DNA binding protein
LTPRPLLNAEQAGALLNVPPGWVLAQARAGRIPHVRLGRYVRFEEAALEAWWVTRLEGPSYTRGNPKKSGSTTKG